MTSAIRTSDRHPAGFTLLEIVVVLTVAAILMGGAVGLFAFNSNERALNDASGEIELLAKRARTMAILQQTSYALEFQDGVVRLMPFAVAVASDGDRKSSRSRRFSDEEQAAMSSDEREIFLKDGMALSIRRWSSEKWLKVEKNSAHVWRFDPDGLCEPITVRLTVDESWSEDSYHPLTASIRDQQSEIR
jgi:prepilin-type N-terminal cleavage/methylation domain-containing protein